MLELLRRTASTRPILEPFPPFEAEVSVDVTTVVGLIPFHYVRVVNALVQQMTQMGLRIEELEKHITEPHLRVVEAREVSLEDAVREVEEYLKTKRLAYPSDMADELGLEYDVVLKAIQSLEKKGKVRPTSAQNTV